MLPWATCMSEARYLHHILDTGILRKSPWSTAVLVLVPFENLNILQAEYVEKLEPGLHSTKGIGKTEPDPAGNKELDGCKVILTNLLITQVGHPSK